MSLLFALFLAMPQDYINLIVEGKYDEAIAYCDEMINTTMGAESFKWQLEKGDVYFDKMSNEDKALEIYQSLIDSYPPAGGFWIFSKRYKYPDLGWMYLRLAQALEMNEDYLNSAKAYEVVATQFRKYPLDSFALRGVERCFKKNYQDFVATIDGYHITRLELDEVLATRPRDEQAVLDDIILQRLIYANAVKENVKQGDYFKENYPATRRSILLEEVRAYDIVDKAIPKEYEMKRYYNTHKDKYKLLEEVRGKEIVVESESLAQVLLDTLTKNIEAFDSLAREYSTVTSRSMGGNMGQVFRDKKPKPVEDVLFRAELNTLTDIVPFDDKFGLYIVIQYKPERYREYDAVKSQIEASVKDEKMKELEKKLMNRLRLRANIKTFEIPEDSVVQDTVMIVATINGRNILWYDLQKRNESQPFMARANLSQPEEREKLLDKLIDEQLQIEWAERNKYYLHDGYFERLKNEVTKLMSGGLYMKIVVEGTSVDSQEVIKFYDDNKETFKMLESVRCLEMIVGTKQLAQDLRATILENPELFDSLAIQHSIGPTKRRGGDTGLISRGVRPHIWDKYAFNTPVDSLSPVFAIDDTTYAFVKVLEHTSEGYRSLEDMWQQIETRLLREKQRQVTNDYLKQIREDANIEIFLDKAEEENEE
jgi:parvulin-like peptidyl-prolyl isomerase